MSGLRRGRENALRVDLLGLSLDDRRLFARLQDGQEQREADESYERPGRQLVKESRSAPSAEGRLGAASAEGSGDVRALALLDQDHQDQKEADEDVNNDQRGVSNPHGAS